MDPATWMYHHGIPLAGSNMYHHGLVLVTHFGPARALTAAAVAAMVTMAGMAGRRFRGARHRS